MFSLWSYALCLLKGALQPWLLPKCYHTKKDKSDTFLWKKVTGYHLQSVVPVGVFEVLNFSQWRLSNATCHVVSQSSHPPSYESADIELTTVETLHKQSLNPLLFGYEANVPRWSLRMVLNILCSFSSRLDARSGARDGRLEGHQGQDERPDCFQALRSVR